MGTRFFRIYIYFISILILPLGLTGQNDIKYSFIVAGHAYGSHDGDNLGLHPPFLESLNTNIDPNVEFIILAGDIVNTSTDDSWNQVETELNAYNLSYYYVMGNHDANSVGVSAFIKKHGATYYSFDYNKERFIILNSNEQERAISSNQVEFLQAQFENMPDSIEQVFIFFHEVLWNSSEKYKGVKSNSRSRYTNIKAQSNFWTDLYPMFEIYTENPIYVISGDVAGNPDAIPAFYDQFKHLTLVSTGMGEVEEENYLIVDVLKSKVVDYRLIPLRENVVMKDIEYYSVPVTPGIYGETLISLNQLNQQYVADVVENAQEYIWSLPEQCIGNSISNEIDITFNTNFTEGELSVQAYHESFGSSEPNILNVNMEGVSNNEIGNKYALMFYVVNQNGHNYLYVESSIAGDYNIQLYNIQGKLLFSRKIFIDNISSQYIQLSKTNNDIGIVSISENGTIVKTKKCFLGN